MENQNCRKRKYTVHEKIMYAAVSAILIGTFIFQTALCIQSIVYINEFEEKTSALANDAAAVKQKTSNIKNKIATYSNN
ncbi:MAG: hypothetical protein J6N52_12925 [Clostridia bacterium]|nr:hypothetical protein [Clostridia bacterium]